MYRWIGALIIGMAALAVLASGCGEDSATSSSLTKAEFVDQAGAICAQREKEWQQSLASYNKQIEEKNAESDLKAQEEIAVVLMEKEMLPAVKNQIEKLKELPAPEGDEAKISKMVNGLSEELSKVEKEGLYAFAKSLSFQDFEQEAKKYGFECTFG